MKKLPFRLLFLLTLFGANLLALNAASGEQFGHKLNVGGGVGYFNDVDRPMPVIHADFELPVVRNFTLAPFVSIYAYRTDFYVGNPNDGNKHYYRETVVPVGVKGTYYFDELLQAPQDWDFYAAASLGVAIANTGWDAGYDGDRSLYNGSDPFFRDLHIGAEYHINRGLGIFLDLSTGVSTLGFSFHLIK